MASQPIYSFLVASVRDEKFASKATLVLRNVIHSKDAAHHAEKVQLILTAALDLLVGDDKGEC